MKLKQNYIIASAICLILLTNVVLIVNTKNREKQIRQKESDVDLYSQLINNNVNVIGNRICIFSDDSVSLGPKVVFRFTESSCLDCVIQALDLMENVIKQKANSVIICPSAQISLNRQFGYRIIQVRGTFCNLDTIPAPYICVIDTSGVIIFSYVLYPANLELNKDMLLKISDRFL
jgi:hypothetical protein